MTYTYKRPFRKVFSPVGWDRFDSCSPEQPAAGQIVHVTSAWGPFRGLEWTTPDGARHHGSCGQGSLRPVRSKS
jgi:hypothetical protein